MDPASFRRLKDVLFGALERPPGERAAYLDRACDRDAAFRAEVERMLADEDVSTADLTPRTPPAGGAYGDLETLLSPPREVGGFRLVRVLGRGGMGVVFEAERRDGGERVALKFLHPHLVADDRLRARLRREAGVGQAVGHPNVVRVHGLEVVDLDGAPLSALVMEYVEGRHLRALHRELRQVPEALLRELAAQIAAGLAAIHAAGIVHRDLKPENVLVTPEHAVRIMDLGVARSVHASMVLTRTGQFVGSLAYASPEQFRADDVEARSDLYSLGVMLYELATGLNPFDRGDVAAVMQAHLETVPPPARQENGAISPFFSDVLDRLLAKDPERRFGSAAELADVLTAGEDGPWWRRRAARRRARRMALPRVLVRKDTGLHGRGPELERLREAWRDAAQGAGSVVLLEGEAGIGKTRLVDTFLREVTADESHVLYGSFPPDGGLRGLCEALVDRFGARGVEDALERYCSAVSGLVPAFVALVRGDPPPPGQGPLTTTGLAVVCQELLQRLASDRPTVWVIDDLHFAPEEARAVAQALARTVSGARPGEAAGRALLVLTTRPRHVERERESLRRLPRFRHLHLGRLSPREVGDLLADALGTANVAARLSADIAQKSDGVPFFVLETVRSLEESGQLRRTKDGAVRNVESDTGIEVPSAVRDLIVARLDDLERSDRDILDVAAVLGHAFDPTRIPPVLERRVVGVLRDLAEIERRHGLVRADGRLYRFDHHQFQEVLYRAIPEPLRREYHGLLADAAIARAGDASPPAESWFVARHGLAGSRAPSALPFVARALEHLRAQGLHEDAASLAGAALDVEPGPSGAERIELLLGRCGDLELMGARDEQARSAAEAVEIASDLGDRALEARARLAAGRAALGRSLLDDAARTLRAAAEVARAADDLATEGKITSALGSALARLGLFDEARTVLERCLVAARETRDRSLAAFALTYLGTTLFLAGDRDGGLAAMRRACSAAEKADDPRARATAEARLGTSLLSLGEQDEAVRLLGSAAALADRVGDRSLGAKVRGSLGLDHMGRGQLADARRHFVQQRRIGEETGDRGAVAQACANLAQVDLTLGRAGRAMEATNDALVAAEEMGDPRIVHYVLLLRTHVVRERDGPLAGLPDVDEALRRAREAGSTTNEAGALLERAWCHLEADDPEAARPAVDEARRLMGEEGFGTAALYALLLEARLPENDGAEARRLFEELEPRLAIIERILSRYQLWKATGDDALLAEARRLILVCRDHAPERDRAAVLQDHRVHAEIVAHCP